MFHTFNYLNDTNSMGTLGRFNEDVSNFLMSMGGVVNHIYRLLDKCSMLYKESDETDNHHQRGDGTEQENTQQLVHVTRKKRQEWTDLAGCVQENAQLCRTLFVASMRCVCVTL